MGDERRPALSVLLCSSGNPDATFLAAGLLRAQAAIGTVVIQGVSDAVPAPEVGRVLAERGLDVRDWVPQGVREPPAEPVAVGLTICVPT